ncbi:DNA phosphorothioation-dependent restriction protein DptG [Fonticella tunisiensis]|uniref:DNA phosphorothioation-dependent restriction protein DptG n=1 Tax=Fonticella tunisiensis TaxID=1096341 RepID=A0A4R7KTM7_9CLOT|nr:DNA phosphorothioation-dependent restriction protein DptG [Fonticella tunisiensis]
MILLRRRRYRSYTYSTRFSKWNKTKRIILTLLIAIPIISAVVYALFFYPVKIDCGVVVDRKESSKLIKLKLSYGDRTRWIHVDKKLNIPDSPGYNVFLKGNRLISISPCKTYIGKVLSRSSDKIELEGKTLSLATDVRFITIEDKKAVNVSPNKVIVGYSTYKFLTDNNGMVRSVIVEKPEISYVRVGISTADLSSLDHTKLEFLSKTERSGNINLGSGKGLQIKSTNIDYTAKGTEAIQLVYEGDVIKIISGEMGKDYTFTPKQQIGTTKDRIYISPVSSGPTLIPTLTRPNRYVPAYYGSFEVFIKDKAMRLINEVDIEKYLRYVVPSEMSPYAKAEGYKAQAVAARTYVLSDMLSGRFAKSGFHVDDTTLSQVYNNQPSKPEVDAAIEQTKGEVLTYKNNIIDAKYYSTSSGVGAPFNEIWYNNKKDLRKNSEPYLTFKDYTNSGIKDLSDDKAASDFFKDWTIKAYDSDEKLFRWKVSIPVNDFYNNVNSAIYERYKNDPKSFKKKWYFNIYRQANIAKNGIGNIQDIFISKRGRAGNVLEMTIVSDTGTYKVEKERNIKKILVPRSDNVILTNKLGKEESLKNYGYSLPSGFFYLDRYTSGGKIRSITLYGGGYGHGVGMSQNAVVSLERAGKGYRDILLTFYDGVEIKDFRSII